MDNPKIGLKVRIKNERDEYFGHEGEVIRVEDGQVVIRMDLDDREINRPANELEYLVTGIEPVENPPQERFQLTPELIVDVSHRELGDSSTSRLTIIQQLIHLPTMDQPLDMGGSFDVVLESHEPIWRRDERLTDDAKYILNFNCDKPYLVVVKNTTKNRSVIKLSDEQQIEFDKRTLLIGWEDGWCMELGPGQCQPLFRPRLPIQLATSSPPVSFTAFAVER